MNVFDFMISNSPDNTHRIYGVTVGIVTNNKDPEKLGRVKLKLPDRLGDMETDWARIATMMGGNSMGTFFLPDVNDEVLVVFREGDIREPYVIGALWNSKEKPPETNEDGKNNKKIIKSRKGHTVTIDDDDQGGGIELKTEGGAVVNMANKDKKITVETGGTKAEFDGNSNVIKVTGNSKVEISAGSSKVVIDGQGNSVEISSSAKVSVKGASVEVKASGTLDIKSDGMINIKGSMVKIN